MEEIFELEMRLLSRDVRASVDELDELLADEFIEIGSSGRVYTKDEVIRSLPGGQEAQFVVTNFETQALSSDIVLATYHAEKVFIEDGRSMRSMRSSLWKSYGQGWQMIFHQGTRIEG